jgi:hypothetical protein
VLVGTRADGHRRGLARLLADRLQKRMRRAASAASAPSC